MALKPSTSGSIAVTQRANAAKNPRALMRTPITLDDYLAARWIAEPFRLLDCCLETDGACALVITTAERARDLAPPAACSSPRAAWGGGDSHLSGGAADPTTSAAAALAPRLYAQAGLGPADIDVAELYDCFTYSVLVQLEDYGFCAKGEGGPYAASGATALAARSRSTRTAASCPRATCTASTTSPRPSPSSAATRATARCAGAEVALSTAQPGYILPATSALHPRQRLSACPPAERPAARSDQLRCLIGTPRGGGSCWPGASSPSSAARPATRSASRRGPSARLPTARARTGRRSSRRARWRAGSSTTSRSLPGARGAVRRGAGAARGGARLSVRWLTERPVWRGARSPGDGQRCGRRAATPRWATGFRWSRSGMLAELADQKAEGRRSGVGGDARPGGRGGPARTRFLPRVRRRQDSGEGWSPRPCDRTRSTVGSDPLRGLRRSASGGVRSHAERVGRAVPHAQVARCSGRCG